MAIKGRVTGILEETGPTRLGVIDLAAASPADLDAPCLDGFDLFVISGAQTLREEYTEAVRELATRTEAPIATFLTGPEAVIADADAIIFPYLLNSADSKYAVDIQVSSAREIKTLGLEVVQTAVIMKPGTDSLFGWENKSKPIQPQDMSYYGLVLMLRQPVMLILDYGREEPLLHFIEELNSKLGIPIASLCKEEQREVLFAKAGAKVILRDLAHCIR